MTSASTTAAKTIPNLKGKKKPVPTSAFTSVQHIQPEMFYAQTVNKNKTQENNQAIPKINQPVNNLSKLEKMRSELME
jgi:hypothetical protein